MDNAKKLNRWLVLFAVFYGVYFTFLFVYYFAFRNNIPIEFMVVAAYQSLYAALFYAGIALIPLFVILPVYAEGKKYISRLSCFLLLSTPVFAGWFIAKLVMLLMVTRPGWEQ